MRDVWLTSTVIGPEGPVAPETMYQCTDEEAERLIAIGAGIDPDQRIVAPLTGAAAADAEAVEELMQEIVTLRQDLEALNAKIAANDAALAAAHAEIDALTKANADLQSKKAK